MTDGVRVISDIRPKNDADFPVVEDVFFKGGLRVEPTTASRDAIPTLRRKEGMFVFVLETNKLFRLASDLTTWVEFAGTGAAVPDPTGEAGDALFSDGLAYVLRLIDDSDLVGGFQVVADLTARDAIATAHRKEGMRVKVVSDGKTYELVGGIANANWSEVVAGAAADDASLILATQVFS